MSMDKIASLLVAVFCAFLLGHSVGSSNARTAYLGQEQKLQAKLKIQEEAYLEEISQHIKTLQTLEASNDEAITSLNSRLLSSQARESYYRELSETGAGGCRELAEISTEYERNLTRGALVVRRLAETSARIVRQNEALIGIIHADRQLVGER